MYIPDLPYYKELSNILSKALEVAVGAVTKETDTKQVVNVLSGSSEKFIRNWTGM